MNKDEILYLEKCKETKIINKKNIDFIVTLFELSTRLEILPIF